MVGGVDVRWTREELGVKISEDGGYWSSIYGLSARQQCYIVEKEESLSVNRCAEGNTCHSVVDG